MGGKSVRTHGLSAKPIRPCPAPHLPRAAFIYSTTRKLAAGHARTNIKERVCDLAAYIIDNQTTVRAAAKQFGISKSTVHKDLTERLPRINPTLYRQVRALLDLNKAERHIRGGLATRRKYKGE